MCSNWLMQWPHLVRLASSGTLDVPQNIQDDVLSVITTAWQAA